MECSGSYFRFALSLTCGSPQHGDCTAERLWMFVDLRQKRANYESGSRRDLQHRGPVHAVFTIERTRLAWLHSVYMLAMR